MILAWWDSSYALISETLCQHDHVLLTHSIPNHHEKNTIRNVITVWYPHTECFLATVTILPYQRQMKIISSFFELSVINIKSHFIINLMQGKNRQHIVFVYFLFRTLWFCIHILSQTNIYSAIEYLMVL